MQSSVFNNLFTDKFWGKMSNYIYSFSLVIFWPVLLFTASQLKMPSNKAFRLG